MADPTPGQVAYTVFVQRWTAYPHHSPQTVRPEPWPFLSPLHQECWEAAAQAVLRPRVAGQAAQLHQLIDALVAHAAPVLLDKVHLWLSDVTASAHQPATRRQEGDADA